MKNILIIIQIVLAISLTVLIFFQSSGDEGRGNLISTVEYEKRGWEKVMFNTTIFLLILFLISSVVQILI